MNDTKSSLDNLPPPTNCQSSTPKSPPPPFDTEGYNIDFSKILDKYKHYG